MQRDALFTDPLFEIHRLGDWLRIAPTAGSAVLVHESTRAAAEYGVLDVPLPRLAGASYSGRVGGEWWLRLTGCFHGLHDRGAQDGTFVDIGPMPRQSASAAEQRIREAVPMPRFEPVAALAEVLGDADRVWLTVVARWQPAPPGQPDLEGALAAFPRGNIPPIEMYGQSLSIRGLLEGPAMHGAGRHVLHVLNWAPAAGIAAVNAVVGRVTTLPPGLQVPSEVAQVASTMAAARPFDRFTEGMPLDDALALFPHRKIEKIRGRIQCEDAELSPGLKGTALLVFSPGLTKIELTIPLGPEMTDAATRAAFAIAQFSVYGTLSAYRRGGSTDPVEILSQLVASPPEDDHAAIAEPLAFVDGKRRLPFQLKYWAAAPDPSLIYLARADWVFDLRRG